MAKTNPTSIRFDEDQLNFVKTEEKIDSPQKVVNFLLNKYWWERRSSPIVSGEINKRVVDEPTKVFMPEVSQYDAYRMELKNAGSIPDIKAIVKAIKTDQSLSSAQKVKLEQEGIELSKLFDF